MGRGQNVIGGGNCGLCRFISGRWRKKVKGLVYRKIGTVKDANVTFPKDCPHQIEPKPHYSNKTVRYN